VAVTKTDVVSVRVPPEVKAALVAAAEQERRSLASMVEFMVLNYCKTHGIASGPMIAGKRARSRG
jgi:predicted HicB family RNase H-like nuclease